MKAGVITLSQIIKLILPTPFKVGPVNVYIIKGNALTLVDTGPRDQNTWNVLQEGLKKHFLRIKDFDQIVLTHFHTDHVGLVGEILEQKDLPIYSHPKAVPYLEREPQFLQMREDFFTSLYKLHGVPVELLIKLKETEEYLRRYDVPMKIQHLLQEGDRLPGDTDWEIIETPGHSPDHISLYSHRTHDLIGGDHLLKHISSNAFVEPVYGTLERPRALLVYQEAMKKLLKLPLKVVYAGHGEDVMDAHSLIRNRIAKQVERAEQLYSLLQEGSDAFTLSAQLFPHLYLKELPLTMSEVIGHIDLLVEMGRLSIEKGRERFWIHKR